MFEVAADSRLTLLMRGDRTLCRRGQEANQGRGSRSAGFFERHRARRAWEHRAGAVDGFTKRHGLELLVYAERHDDIASAIQREKVIKHWPRAYKVRLIADANPRWDDLYNHLA